MPTLAARLTEQLARLSPGGNLHLVWWLRAAGETGHYPDRTLDPAQLAAVRTAVAGLAEAMPPAADCNRTLLLSSRNAQAGAMLLFDPAQSPGDTAGLERWARNVRPYVDNLLEKSQLRDSVERLEDAEKLQRALYAMADMAGSDLDMPTMLRGLHRIVSSLFLAENFYIALYDAPTDSIRFIYFVDTADEDWQTPDAVDELSSIEHSLTWYLIRDARALMGDTASLHRQVSGPLEIIGPHAADWLGVPMLSGGQVRGAIVVQSYDQSGVYTAADQTLLSFVGSHILTALDRKQAQGELERRTHELSEQITVRKRIEQRLQHEVLHDSLTGLPNRACLREHLTRTLARQRRNPRDRFAILFLDLDRFKIINDSAGHLIGDELLKAVAARFSTCVRAPDVVARLGGDEFAILVERFDNDEVPVRLAQRLIASLVEPIRLQGKELFTAVSIGIVLSDPRYTSPEQLLRDADIAMYRAKSSDGARYELFDEALHGQTLDLLNLEDDLRRAIARREFEPYFQPIVRLADAQVVGYEALLRWNHPARGVLAPGEFLHAAQVSGMLETIDWQMFEQTCQLIPALIHHGQYVNLNFSPRHFHADDIDARLLALLRANDVAPQMVRIEITEGALMDKPEIVSRSIDRLRRAGVLTALDDFGTGYSSLSYLHRFRLHTIKIDRSFVADLAPADKSVVAAVVQAVLTLSQSLGLEVVAEGIETQVQRQALLGLGCKLGQGYLFARPQPLAAVLASRGPATGLMARPGDAS